MIYTVYFWIYGTASPIAHGFHGTASPHVFHHHSIPIHNISLSKEVIDGVETFVFFIGWPRSGHTIIAVMMDAHPNIVMGRRFLLFWDKHPVNRELLHSSNKADAKKSLFSELYHDSVYNAHPKRLSAGAKNGYDFAMKSSHQGNFTQLKVIGVKEGGWISTLYHNNPSQIRNCYQRLVNTVQIPIKVLFVVRNPYDMIATNLIYEASNDCAHKLPNVSKDNPYNDPHGLMKQAQKIFHFAAASQDMIKSCNLNVLEIHHADHVRDPKGTMKQICDFLKVEITEEYLQQCYDRAFKSLSKSRETVVWNQHVLRIVEEGIKTYQFFHRYSFDKDY